MSYQEILSMLQETHSHVEKELEGYRSKVSLATAELDAIEATRLLAIPSGYGTWVRRWVR